MHFASLSANFESQVSNVESNRPQTPVERHPCISIDVYSLPLPIVESNGTAKAESPGDEEGYETLHACIDRVPWESQMEAKNHFYYIKKKEILETRFLLRKGLSARGVMQAARIDETNSLL